MSTKRKVVPVPNRMFAVLYSDNAGKWRVAEVKAADHDAAAVHIDLKYPLYNVEGVGMLSGSGHVIRWLNGMR